jgi:hypothetical protein
LYRVGQRLSGLRMKAVDHQCNRKQIYLDRNDKWRSQITNALVKHSTY